jgi:hypothetical protein
VSDTWGVWLLLAVICVLVILGLLMAGTPTPPGAEPY